MMHQQLPPPPPSRVGKSSRVVRREQCYTISRTNRMTDYLQQYFELVFPQKQLLAWERLILLSAFVANNGKVGGKFTVKLGRLATLSGASETSVRQYLRMLADKGVIEIEGFGRDGYRLTLPLPLTIPEVAETAFPEQPAVDIESIAFFEDRQFFPLLLDRQGGACFYSLRKLDERSCELDHLSPQADGLNNSYRNIVCCTFEMNKRKGTVPADVFLRQL